MWHLLLLTVGRVQTTSAYKNRQSASTVEAQQESAQMDANLMKAEGEPSLATNFFETHFSSSGETATVKNGTATASTPRTEWAPIAARLEPHVDNILRVLSHVNDSAGENLTRERDRILAEMAKVRSGMDRLFGMRPSATFNQNQAALRPPVEVTFDACARWHADAGIGGRILVNDGVHIQLWPCNKFVSVSSACVFDPLTSFLSKTLGPLDVLRFAGSNGSGKSTQEYLRLFVETAATKFALRAQDCSQVSVGKAEFKCYPHGCSFCARCDVCLGKQISSDFVEHVFFEMVLVDALAAASSGSASSIGDPEELEIRQVERPTSDHVALAHVTRWMRYHESFLEPDSDLEISDETRACLDKGKLFGYECGSFTYGSTYFHSWLRVMRFPPVDRALSMAAEGSLVKQFVVLGSSLGWQVIWAALTFGIQSIGYEIMRHRIVGAMHSASQVEATSALVQFRHSDVLRSNVSSAAVIYVTDLTWEDELRTSVAAFVKSQLLATRDRGEGVVIVSNAHETWFDMGYTLLGEAEVPVSWTSMQPFFYWAVQHG